MLYEYLSGEVEAWHIAPRYDELLDENVMLFRARPRESISSRKLFRSQIRQTLNYDVLVLALGGITNYVGVEGAEEYSNCRSENSSTQRICAPDGRGTRSHSA